MSIWDPIVNIANKVVGKIPSQNDRNEAAEKILEETGEQDINQANISSKANIKNPLFWLEIICVIGFAYTYVVAPIINDIIHLSFKGIADIGALDNMLYAVFGLGGMRIANTVIAKKASK